MIEIKQVWCKGIRITAKILDCLKLNECRKPIYVQKTVDNCNDDHVDDDDDNNDDDDDVRRWHEQSLQYKLQNPLKNENFAKIRMENFHKKMELQDDSWRQCIICKEIFLRITDKNKCRKCEQLSTTGNAKKYSSSNDAQPFNDDNLRLREIQSGHQYRINEPPWYCKNLTDLEKRMVARILPIATIVKIKKSQQYGIKGSFISVQQNYLPKEITCLPRKIKDCNLTIIQCKNVEDLKNSESLKINGIRI